MAIYGKLKSNTPFNEIFPNGQIELASMFAVRPDIENVPLCYVIDSSVLSWEQKRSLAILLHQTYPDRLSSIEAAIEEVSENFALKADWFKCVEVDGLGKVLHLPYDDIRSESDCEYLEEEWPA